MTIAVLSNTKHIFSCVSSLMNATAKIHDFFKIVRLKPKHILNDLIGFKRVTSQKSLHAIVNHADGFFFSDPITID